MFQKKKKPSVWTTGKENVERIDTFVLSDAIVEDFLFKCDKDELFEISSELRNGSWKIALEYHYRPSPVVYEITIK